MFPTSIPVRCEACSGTSGPNKCASEDETWFSPCNESHQDCKDQHKASLANYSSHHDKSQNWWVKGVSIPSSCPRAIDCPDWQYQGEKPYSRQLALLKSLSKVMDLNKVSIGFETLGTDVQVQMRAYEDPALPWTDVSPKQMHQQGIYYKDCHQNMSSNNTDKEMRCR